MKKIIFAITTGLISLLAITSGANAQGSNNLDAMQHPLDAAKIEKLVSSESNKPEIISVKALKDFKKFYREVADVKWHSNEFTYTATFDSNGINTTVYYDKKGHWRGELKNYKEDKLDRNVRSIVKREYYDYKIFHVQEIETSESNGIPTYLVHIETDNDIKAIWVRDGAMGIYEQFKNQNSMAVN